MAHRDYYSNGSVEVRVFSDRVEILNPGELPPGKDIAWLMGEHVSIPANPLIAEAFYQTRYIDRAGSGIDDMADACRSEGLPPPQIKVEYQSFVTVLRRQVHDENPMKNPIENPIKNPIKNAEETVSKKTVSDRLREILPSCTEKKIRTATQVLEYLRKHPTATYEDVVSALNISFWTVKDYITLMKESAVLFRNGGNKGGNWEVHL